MANGVRLLSPMAEEGTLQHMHDALREAVRQAEGRDATPTVGIVDAQSLRGADTVGAATGGYSAGKKVNGRSVATIGNVYMRAFTLVTTALMVAIAVALARLASTKYVITSSKQIKPGSIALSALSRAARHALAGKAGPAGSKGAKGDPGVKGDQGPKGDPGPSATFETALADVVVSSMTATSLLTLQLPPGTHLLSAQGYAKNNLNATPSPIASSIPVESNFAGTSRASEPAPA
jgi:hypothetical protein